MYSQWIKEQVREIDPQSLKAYIEVAPGEWNRELKLCAEDVDYGVRKSVAALGNDRGGEVFVGVTEAREIRGTDVASERIAQVLHQENALRGAWFVTDLTRAVREVTPVPVGDGRTAFVLEVVQQSLPLLVQDKQGKLWLHVRNGSESARLSGFEALEWYRSRRRAEVLRTIYEELKLMSERFVPFNLFPPTLSPPLPYFMEMARSGELYRYLEPEDLLVLLGGPSGNSRRQGFLEPLLDFLRKAEAVAAEVGPGRLTTLEDTPRGLDFANFGSGLKSAVTQLRNYLVRVGIQVG